MAILTSEQLTEIRRRIEPESPSPINYTKLQINDAVQAVENWWDANRTSLSAVIDTATTPFVFTNEQKKRLIKYWLRQKFERGG